MTANAVCRVSTIPCDPELIDSVESAVWFFAFKAEYSYHDCADISQTAVEILLQRESLWRSSPGSISYRLFQDAAERHRRLQIDKLTMGAELSADVSRNHREYIPTEKQDRENRMISFRAGMIRRNRQAMQDHFAAWVVETIDDAIREMECDDFAYKTELLFTQVGPFRFPFVLSCEPFISHQTDSAACCELVAVIR
jgi:hypothetical protein